MTSSGGEVYLLSHCHDNIDQRKNPDKKVMWCILCLFWFNEQQQQQQAVNFLNDTYVPH